LKSDRLLSAKNEKAICHMQGRCEAP